jgi:sucrose-6-phosphate hydrolase SacC (GH32 family)
LLWSIVDRTRGGLTGTRYIVGDFDGRAFHPHRAEDTGLTFDYGPDVYAPLTWSNAPGPPTVMAWMSSWSYARRIPPTPSFTGGPLTIPRVLSLHATSEGFELAQSPLPALRKLRGRPLSLTGLRLRDVRRPLPIGSAVGQSFELLMRWRRSARRFGVRVRAGPDEATEIGIASDGNVAYLDRRRSGRVDFAARFPGVFHAPLPDDDPRVALHVFVDRSSVEVFAAGGRRVLSAQVYPRPDSAGVELFAEGGEATLERLTLWPLSSIWAPRRATASGASSRRAR